jgi:hypothetical protein
MQTEQKKSLATGTTAFHGNRHTRNDNVTRAVRVQQRTIGMMDIGSARFGFNYTNDKKARTETWKVAVVGTCPRVRLFD